MTTNPCWTRIGVAFLVVAAGAPAGAQVAGIRPPVSVCWIPRPAERCRNYLIAEVAAERPAFTSSGRHSSNGGSWKIADYEGRLAITTGYMTNRPSGSALGITSSFTPDDLHGEFPTRLEVRYRDWRTQSLGRDYSLGITRKGIRAGDNFTVAQAVGLTGSAGVGNHWIGIDARLDLVRGPGRTASAVFLGMRSGPKGVPIVAAGTAAFMALLIAAMGNAST